MNYYEILGVAEGASKIEIEEAYNEKVSEIKSGVKNEKNAAAFIKILTEAYEHLINDYDHDFQEEEITDIEDTDQYYDEDEDDNDCEDDPNYEDGKVVDLDSFYNDGDDEEDEDDDFTIIDRKVKEMKKKKKAKKKRKSKELDNKKTKNKRDKEENNYYEIDEADEDDEESLPSKIKRQKDKSQRRDVRNEQGNGTGWFMKLLLLPIKLLLIPVVAVIWLLSIILKVINFAAWIVSKVLLTAAIAILAIHSYQIYKGAAADKKILFATGAVIGISIFLPPILKVMYKVLSNTSDSLLEFIF